MEEATSERKKVLDQLKRHGKRFVYFIFPVSSLIYVIGAAVSVIPALIGCLIFYFCVQFMTEQSIYGVSLWSYEGSYRFDPSLKFHSSYFFSYDNCHCENEYLQIPSHMFSPVVSLPENQTRCFSVTQLGQGFRSIHVFASPNSTGCESEPVLSSQMQQWKFEFEKTKYEVVSSTYGVWRRQARKSQEWKDSAFLFEFFSSKRCSDYPFWAFATKNEYHAGEVNEEGNCESVPLPDSDSQRENQPRSLRVRKIVNKEVSGDIGFDMYVYFVLWVPTGIVVTILIHIWFYCCPTFKIGFSIRDLLDRFKG